MWHVKMDQNHRHVIVLNHQMISPLCVSCYQSFSRLKWKHFTSANSVKYICCEDSPKICIFIWPVVDQIELRSKNKCVFVTYYFHTHDSH